MAFDNPRAGFNATAEFQVSALPWMTSSVVTGGTVKRYDFTHFTKFVIVKNTTAGTVAQVAVNLNGFSRSNYFELVGGESVSLDWRIRQLFVSGSTGSPSVSVVAGLTGIEAKQWPIITGSMGFEGVG